jgi:AmiR/NasT family two-component response regulator
MIRLLTRASQREAVMANAPNAGWLMEPENRRPPEVEAKREYDHTPPVSDGHSEQLRVLIADERADRLTRVAAALVELGHEVVAREIEVNHVGATTVRVQPDVALVRLGYSSDHALELIDRIVAESACPVIALVDKPDPDFVNEASKRGVFAYVSDTDVEDWASSIDIVLRRFAEYHNLEGAFGRRAIIERAKGILMERHTIDDGTAFEMLREQSRIQSLKIIDVAYAVVHGHSLLPRQPAPAIQVSPKD